MAKRKASRGPIAGATENKFNLRKLLAFLDGSAKFRLGWSLMTCRGRAITMSNAYEKRWPTARFS